LKCDAVCVNIGWMIADRSDDPNPIHRAFFDALGNMRETDERWLSTVAGLVTLRLVDKWDLAARGKLNPSAAEIGAVRRAIAAAPVSPLCQALTGIVTAIANAWGQRVPVISARVLAYAALLYEAEEWALAADVYRTFLLFAATESDMGLAVHAWIRLGTALTMIGDLTQAQRAHETGHAMAVEQRARYLERLAEHGLAVVALHRGNLPAADEQLGAVIAACETELEAEPSLADVLARALHDRGWVALRRGETARAFGLLHRALTRAQDPRKKDRVLHDLATAFLDLPDHATARHAFAILERQAQDPMVRWASALNLMHLAVLDGAETTFERYRRVLAREPMPPRLAVDLRIYEARGCWQFGRREQARVAFDRAIGLAEMHQLNEQVIAAEATRAALERLAEAERSVVVPVQEAPLVIDPEVARVARAIAEMHAEVVGAGS
jgi:tetratricopeptide (TPR) repeat protein